MPGGVAGPKAWTGGAARIQLMLREQLCCRLFRAYHAPAAQHGGRLRRSRDRHAAATVHVSSAIQTVTTTASATSTDMGPKGDGGAAVIVGSVLVRYCWSPSRSGVSCCGS